MISLIVATAHNNVIGKGNDLPWYIPADLRYFKEKTTGSTIIMGRHTADSILARIHKPLPSRTNIVISRNSAYCPEGFICVRSLEEALVAADTEDVYIIGGAQVYELALPFIETLYRTEIDATITGDAFFPEIAPSEFVEIAREDHSKDDANQYNYSFVTYRRR